MCGIFGVLGEEWNSSSGSKLLLKLASLSQRRGSDSAGFFLLDPLSIQVQRGNEDIQQQLKIADKKGLFTKCQAFAGFTRLATHGLDDSSNEGQPLVLNNVIFIHNGIVTNFQEFVDSSSIDSLAIGRLLANGEISLESTQARLNEINLLLNELEGEITFILVSTNGCLIAYSNVGNLYFAKDRKNNTWFASEEYFLRSLGLLSIDQIALKSVLVLRESDQKTRSLSILPQIRKSKEDNVRLERRILEDNQQTYASFYKCVETIASRQIQRCTRCILPSTFPGISFNFHGVCSLCANWVTPRTQGLSRLHELLEIRTRGSIPVQVNVSGGRDSSYMLIRLKEMGFRIKAVTYDWGFVTTSARENIANLCGQLGLEHIVISPNINRNRELVRECIIAWFKKPSLGTIPALMAGDKLQLSTSLQVSRENGNMPIVQGDHWLETTGFKSAFAGARFRGFSQSSGVSYRLSVPSIFRMSLSYFLLVLRADRKRFSLAKQLFQSAFVYYFRNHRLIHFFNYEPWEEENVNKLVRQYGWKSNPLSLGKDWRMGDATAPFYNFLYLLLTGFTENDALRSNQIRAGFIERSDALQLVQKENQIDLIGINSYLNLIGIDLNRFWEVMVPTLLANKTDLSNS